MVIAEGCANVVFPPDCGWETVTENVWLMPSMPVLYATSHCLGEPDPSSIVAMKLPLSLPFVLSTM